MIRSVSNPMVPRPSHGAGDWAKAPDMIQFLIVFATVWAMEFVAWSSHKYVMHGFGWGWHRDHHEPHDGILEKNDRFAIVGAAMSAIIALVTAILFLLSLSYMRFTFRK